MCTMVDCRSGIGSWPGKFGGVTIRGLSEDMPAFVDRLLQLVLVQFIFCACSFATSEKSAWLRVCGVRQDVREVLKFGSPIVVVSSGLHNSLTQDHHPPKQSHPLPPSFSPPSTASPARFLVSCCPSLAQPFFAYGASMWCVFPEV